VTVPHEEPPDYLVIGHVTRDLMPDGSYRPGGTATYAGLAAHRLGLRVGVVTSAAPLDATIEAGIAVEVRPAPQTTTFENLYPGGARRQFCRAVAARLTLDDVPVPWRHARIVHLGPVAQEVDPQLVFAFGGALIGVTPQGWLRRWGADGRVQRADWPQAREVLSRAGAVFVSADDLWGDRALLRDWVRWAPLLVLTVGKEGAIVYHSGRQRRFPAYVVSEVDPTGAGDVFAAAYLVRLSETGDPYEAAQYANCAASFVVEGVGATCIPTRDEVERRLRHGRLRFDPLRFDPQRIE
jgi:1D-myo-inositol 3-kinase